MTRDEAEFKLVSTIEKVLREHPDLAGSASGAISRGVGAAAQEAMRDAGRARLALALALALLPPNRITDEARTILTQTIRDVIGKPECEAERRFVEGRAS